MAPPRMPARAPSGLLRCALLAAGGAALCLLGCRGLAFSAPPPAVRGPARAQLTGATSLSALDAAPGTFWSRGLPLCGLLGGLAALGSGRHLAVGRREKALFRSEVLDKVKALRVRPFSLVSTPKETFEALVEKGVANGNMSVLKTLHASVMGGCYVGMAGLLSLCITGGLPHADPGMVKQTFAALFPVNLLLVLQSGAQLFTGNTATLSAALIEGRVTFRQLLKSWVVSYIGNVVGCGLLALTAAYCGLLSNGTDAMAVAYTMKKCSLPFLPTMVKAIMCNWLVSMAVYLSMQAKDLTGKMVGIWFPISMFVAIGFEHSVANMFILPAGLLSHAPLSVADVLLKNMLPVTIGNTIAGALVVGAGFSFAFGSLGRGANGSFRGIFGKLLGRSA